MARAPKGRATAPDPKPKTTAVANWDEELARDAQAAASQEASAGGAPTFSTKGGVLTFNEAPIPGNTIAAVILASMMENTFYEEAYDPDALVPPTCYALGNDADTLAPHPDVVEHEQAQNDNCKTCPMNQFGSADRGKGKACGNRRRLMVIPAGTIADNGRFTPFDEASDYETAIGGMMKVPPTSLRGWANFVKQLTGVMGLPPHGVYAKIQLIPDAKTQFKLTFSALDKIPGDFMPTIMKRRQEALTVIDQPYNLDVEAVPEPQKKPAKGRRPEVKKRAAKY